MKTTNLPLLHSWGETVFRTPVILGREEEVAAIERALASDEATALVLRGDPGSGKTTLLEAAAERFAARGGRIGPAVAAGPDTTERRFSTAVRSAYRLRGRPELPASSAQPPDEAVPASPTRAEPVHPLVAALAEDPGRVLLRIDEYDPHPDFARWFDERFLPSILASNAAIVVLVAAGPDAPPIEAVPTIGVPPLRRPQVADHFRRVGMLLDPPAHGPEVEAIVEAAVQDPYRIDRLTRALSLARIPIEDQ